MDSPEHVINPDGIVTHIFKIDSQLMLEINNEFINNTTITPSSVGSVAYFGTVTRNGCIEIWKAFKFCRVVLSISSGLANCSWAGALQIDSKLKFVIYSRTSGLYCTSNRVSGDEVSFVSIEIPGGPHAGFCIPYSSNNEMFMLNANDNIIHWKSLKSKQCSNLQIRDLEHPTFLIGFTRDDWKEYILVGSENGKVLLVSTKNSKSSITSVDLLKSELVQMEKKNCPIPEEENLEVPLCCTGDETNGMFVIGTRANVIVVLKVEPEVDCLSISRCKRLPTAGVNSMAIHPNKEFLVVAGWDSVVRIFSFPSMEDIGTIEHGLHLDPGIVTFITKNQTSQQPKNYLAIASYTPVLSLWNFDIGNKIVLFNYNK